MTKFYINEIFGPTCQGEGPSAGTPAWFIRNSGCSLFCNFCDTAYSWRFSDIHPHRDNVVYQKEKESEEYTLEDLQKLTIYDIKTPLLVITGGEPLLQRKAWDRYLTWFFDEEHVNLSVKRIEFETAGILYPLWGFMDLVKYNVSPKLESSGNPKELRYKPEILREFRHFNASFKFVVTSNEDLKEIESIVKEINIPNELVYLMAEGNTKEEQLQKMDSVIKLCIEKNWNYSPRLHVLAWGSKRGV